MAPVKKSAKLFLPVALPHSSSQQAGESLVFLFTALPGIPRVIKKIMILVLKIVLGYKNEILSTPKKKKKNI